MASSGSRRLSGRRPSSSLGQPAHAAAWTSGLRSPSAASPRHGGASPRAASVTSPRRGSATSGGYASGYTYTSPRTRTRTHGQSAASATSSSSYLTAYRIRRKLELDKPLYRREASPSGGYSRMPGDMQRHAITGVTQRVKDEAPRPPVPRSTRGADPRTAGLLPSPAPMPPPPARSSKQRPNSKHATTLKHPKATNLGTARRRNSSSSSRGGHYSTTGVTTAKDTNTAGFQQAVCKVFESFDHASAGLVSVLDFKRGLQFLGVHRVHTPEAVNKWISRLDPGGRGVVQYRDAVKHLHIDDNVVKPPTPTHTTTSASPPRKSPTSTRGSVGAANGDGNQHNGAALWHLQRDTSPPAGKYQRRADDTLFPGGRRHVQHVAGVLPQQEAAAASSGSAHSPQASPETNGEAEVADLTLPPQALSAAVTMGSFDKFSMAAHDAAASSLHHITPAPSAARQAEEEVPTVGMRSRRRRRRGSAAGSVASSAASVAASMTWSQASGDSYQARHQAARAAALAKALAAQRPFAVDNDTPVLSRSAQTFLRQTSARESAKADEERLFEALDDDGSGRVSSEEFKGVLQEMGVPVAGTSFTVLTDLAGVDTSGIVNYKEFRDTLVRRVHMRKGETTVAPAMGGLKLGSTTAAPSTTTAEANGGEGGGTQRDIAVGDLLEVARGIEQRLRGGGQQLWVLLRRHDLPHNGTVRMAELQQALTTSSGIALSARERDVLSAHLDAGGSGMVDYNNLAYLMKAARNELSNRGDGNSGAAAAAAAHRSSVTNALNARGLHVNTGGTAKETPLVRSIAEIGGLDRDALIRGKRRRDSVFIDTAAAGSTIRANDPSPTNTWRLGKRTTKADGTVLAQVDHDVPMNLLSWQPMGANATGLEADITGGGTLAISTRPGDGSPTARDERSFHVVHAPGAGTREVRPRKMFDAAEPVTTSSGMKDAFTWDTQHQRTRGDKVAPAYHRLSSVHHLQSSQVRVAVEHDGRAETEAGYDPSAGPQPSAEPAKVLHLTQAPPQATGSPAQPRGTRRSSRPPPPPPPGTFPKGGKARGTFIVHAQSTPGGVAELFGGGDGSGASQKRIHRPPAAATMQGAAGGGGGTAAGRTPRASSLSGRRVVAAYAVHAAGQGSSARMRGRKRIDPKQNVGGSNAAGKRFITEEPFRLH